MSLRLGAKEAAMLMDGLVTLRGDWESSWADYPPTKAEQDRMARLMDKLRPLAALSEEER